jgi:hypothetical protein
VKPFKNKNNMDGAFMNPERIEELLRKAPSPKAPEDLLRKLTADIHLPGPTANSTSAASRWNEPRSWARRWLPALSFAAILLTCLVAIGVQINILSELQRENGKLQAAKANLDSLRAGNAEYQRLVAGNQESERLRKDNAELLKLRGEVGLLQAQLQDAGKLRAENQQLRAKQWGLAAGSGGDYSADTEAKIERVHCANNLKQVGLAVRLWADDNNGVCPTNFICMTNELSTWKVLQCPSDKSHDVTNWAEVAAGNISYIMYAPGVLQSDNARIVMAECPIHHNVLRLDGSVQQFPNDEEYNKQIKIVNGRKVFEP